MKSAISLLILSVFSGGSCAQNAVPPGTVLPVKLDSSVSLAKSKQGQVVAARIMQSVPLPAGARIRAGAHVVGHIVELKQASGGSGATIKVKFEALQLPTGAVPVSLCLRAIASPLDVDDAQLPTSSDEGIAATSWTTVQVGGEVVYRGGGHVMNGETIVGEPVTDGVLSRLRANPDRECEGAVEGHDQPQALWVFSSDACGAYGFSHLIIARSGCKDPRGEIVFSATTDRELVLRSGSGMLLRVLGT